MVVSIYQAVNHSVQIMQIFSIKHYAYNYAAVFILCTHICIPDVYLEWKKRVENHFVWIIFYITIIYIYIIYIWHNLSLSYIISPPSIILPYYSRRIIIYYIILYSVYCYTFHRYRSSCLSIDNALILISSVKCRSRTICS